VDFQPDALSAALKELELHASAPVLGRRRGIWQLPFPENSISLHVLVVGRCTVDTDAQLWNRMLRRGDLLVINRGVCGAFAQASAEDDWTEILSARIHLEAPHGHPLLEALPQFIPARNGQIPLPRSLEPTVEALLSELSAPSHAESLLVAELCALLFVQALRVHMLELAWDDRGWFRALADPQVRASMAAIYRTPLPAVTVAELASAGERSRRRFGQRFAQFAGLKAGTFVRRTRARRAAELLREGFTSLEHVARVSGFATRQALCRAFRRELGTTPATYWRRIPADASRGPEGPGDELRVTSEPSALLTTANPALVSRRHPPDPRSIRIRGLSAGTGLCAARLPRT
jgi:AraC-like DNA-binding protein